MKELEKKAHAEIEEELVKKISETWERLEGEETLREHGYYLFSQYKIYKFLKTALSLYKAART